MKTTYLVRTAFQSILTHKVRSLLTILGIVVGIAAIMLVITIGTGAEALVLKQVEGLGAKTVAVAPGRQPSGPTDSSIIETLYGQSLKERELDALSKKSNVPHVSSIMPMVFGVFTASYQSKTYQPMVIGATPLIQRIFNVYPDNGIFFADEDIQSRSAVTIIGTKVKEELFGPSEAIGEKIKINGVNTRVIGTLPKTGQVLFFNFDQSILVPYSFAQHYIFGMKHFNRIILEAEDKKYVPEIVRNIEVTIRDLHNITNPDNDDFFVGTQDELTQTVSTVTGALTMFLASVAAISLLVGGVGIMNIMFVSVTERRKEIGLRKALGATRANILLQFLLEAMVLTLFGGMLGVLIGALLSFFITLVLAQILSANWSFVFPYTAALIGVLVSTAVGMVFGLFPAYRASRKSPLEALRFDS